MPGPKTGARVGDGIDACGRCLATENFAAVECSFSFPLQKVPGSRTVPGSGTVLM